MPAISFNKQISAIIVLFLSGCLSAAPPQKTDEAQPTRTDAKNPKTFVFECKPAFSFVARIEDQTAWLFLLQTTLSLPQVPAASGEKFSDKLTTFWIKNDTALLKNNNTTYRNCKNNRAKAIWEHAKLNGVSFRAVGNEPGWYLEIRNQESILFVADYGSSRDEFPAPQPMIDQQKRKTTYQTHSDGKNLTVVIEGQPCMDSMSGETFAAQVSVMLNQKRYLGCGRALH